MADRSLYRYLGEDLQIDQFQKLAETVQRALGHTSHALEIGTQLTKIRYKHEIWLAKIMATYHLYRLPPLSQQDISILSQKHETRIVEINDIREKSRKELRARIDRRQKLSDDEMAKIDKKYADCLEKIGLIDNKLGEIPPHRIHQRKWGNSTLKEGHTFIHTQTNVNDSCKLNRTIKKKKLSWKMT